MNEAGEVVDEVVKAKGIQFTAAVQETINNDLIGQMVSLLRHSRSSNTEKT